MKRFAALVVAGALLSACGGGGGGVALPSGTSGPGIVPVTHARSEVTFTLKVPASPQASARRTPKYVSASMLSLVVTLTGQNGTPLPSPQAYAANIGSAACPTVSGTPTCSLSVPAPVGSDSFTVTTYDAVQSSSAPATLTGNRLSTAMMVTTVIANTNNSVALTLNGVVASIALALSNAAPPSGTAATIGLSVTARDAGGNVIVGPGSYESPIALTDSDTSGATTLSTTSVIGPSTVVTIAYTGVPAAATFSASAPGVTTATSPRFANQISRIYVAGFSSNSIFTFSPNGTQIAPPITAGINNPFGLALDRSGDIYVANEGNGTVAKFNANGTPQLTLSGLSEPTGVAVDTTGKIYVADDVDNTITSYTPIGTLTTPTITGLNTPESLTLDPSGNIYLANYSAPSVPVYSPTGTLLRTITTGVNAPAGVAVDSSGKIYVANNSPNGPVTTYTASGVQTTPTISLFNPVGVTVDLHGNIYVSNGISVFIYSADGTLTSTIAPPANSQPQGIAVY